MLHRSAIFLFIIAALCHPLRASEILSLEWFYARTNLTDMAVAPDGGFYVFGPDSYRPETLRNPMGIWRVDTHGSESKVGFRDLPNPGSNADIFCFMNCVVSPRDELYFCTKYTSKYTAGGPVIDVLEKFPNEITRAASLYLYRLIDIAFVEADGELTYMDRTIGKLVHLGPQGFSIAPYGDFPCLDPSGDYLFGSSLSGDVIVGKQKRSGEIAWEKRFGGAAAEDYPGVMAAPGAIYLVGRRGRGESIFGAVKFSGREGAYLAKLDSDANVMWAKGIEGYEVSAMESDPKGGFFISLAAITLTGYSGVYLRYYDADGTLVFDKNLSTLNGDYIQKISVSGDRLLCLGLWNSPNFATMIGTEGGPTTGVLSFKINRPPRLRIERNGDATRLTVHGEPDRIYRLESCRVLSATNWMDLGPISSATMPFSIEVSRPDGIEPVFWRAKKLD